MFIFVKHRTDHAPRNGMGRWTCAALSSVLLFSSHSDGREMTLLGDVVGVKETTYTIAWNSALRSGAATRSQSRLLRVASVLQDAS